MFFLYGESLIYYFKHIVFIDEYFLYFAIHHRFISAVLYLMGKPLFFLCLTGKKNRLRVLCYDVDPSVICIPIHSILLDAYDTPTRGLSSPFHRQLDL